MADQGTKPGPEGKPEDLTLKEYAAVHIMQGLLAGGDMIPEVTPKQAVVLAEDLVNKLKAGEAK